MKSGKEINLISPNKDFKIYAGAIENYKAPKSIYLNISSWIRVKDTSINIDSLLRNLKCNLKIELNNIINTNIFNVNETIFDLDISTLGLKNGKSAFLNLEINLTQTGAIMMFPLIQMKTKPSPDLIPYLNQIIDAIVNCESITNNQYLRFSKTKKIKND